MFNNQKDKDNMLNKLQISLETAPLFKLQNYIQTIFKLKIHSTHYTHYKIQIFKHSNYKRPK